MPSAPFPLPAVVSRLLPIHPLCLPAWVPCPVLPLAWDRSLCVPSNAFANLPGKGASCLSSLLILCMMNKCNTHIVILFVYVVLLLVYIAYTLAFPEKRTSNALLWFFQVLLAKKKLSPLRASSSGGDDPEPCFTSHRECAITKGYNLFFLMAGNKSHSTLQRPRGANSSSRHTRDTIVICTREGIDTGLFSLLF